MMKTIYIVMCYPEDGAGWNVLGFKTKKAAERHAEALNKRVQDYKTALEAWYAALNQACPVAPHRTLEDLHACRALREEWCKTNPLPAVPEGVSVNSASEGSTVLYGVEELPISTD